MGDYFREKHENDHSKLCHYLELHEQRRHGLNRWCEIMRVKNYIPIFVLLLRFPKNHTPLFLGIIPAPTISQGT